MKNKKKKEISKTPRKKYNRARNKRRVQKEYMVDEYIWEFYNENNHK